MAEKSTTDPEQSLIPNLPNDISLQCIARIPRPHHPSLSLISKTFHSTLHSPEFFATRSLLNSTQQSLYLNIRVNSSFKWFGKWEIGAKMRVCREFAAAGVVNGSIYVMGGCVGDNFVKSSNWAEVYDHGVGVWKAVDSPVEVREKWMHASCVLDGRIYAMADRSVMYCYDFLGKIRGYDVGKDVWKELRGVERSLPKFLCGATMASLNGKLCVVWERKGWKKEVEIMCAEIEVWKDEDGGLSGLVLWSDVVLRVPFGSSVVHCLSVDL